MIWSLFTRKVSQVLGVTYDQTLCVGCAAESPDEGVDDFFGLIFCDLCFDLTRADEDGNYRDGPPSKTEIKRYVLRVMRITCKGASETEVKRRLIILKEETKREKEERKHYGVKRSEEAP